MRTTIRGHSATKEYVVAARIPGPKLASNYLELPIHHRWHNTHYWRLIRERAELQAIKDARLKDSANRKSERTAQIAAEAAASASESVRT